MIKRQDSRLTSQGRHLAGTLITTSWIFRTTSWRISWLSGAPPTWELRIWCEGSLVTTPSRSPQKHLTLRRISFQFKSRYIHYFDSFFWFKYTLRIIFQIFEFFFIKLITYRITKIWINYNQFLGRKMWCLFSELQEVRPRSRQRAPPLIQKR